MSALYWRGAMRSVSSCDGSGSDFFLNPALIAQLRAVAVQTIYGMHDGRFVPAHRECCSRGKQKAEEQGRKGRDAAQAVRIAPLQSGENYR
ncbi:MULTISPECIES: hypothetical protein [unclassified Herbaspirillum]|uniref:hypothetical protein n=1 Tax=unclassified Herbaspirillum TaxID=2624150 RepID=UPI0010724323|nr:MULTISPECIES: hypothetical protein [unclassified Herbaspirillum]TFI16013.1 hypothetical protein E4P31_00745 [Herbaspirillum sp. 3R-11]